MLSYIIIAIIVVISLGYYTTRTTSKIDIIWFYRPGCPHCDNMMGEWNKFTKMRNRQDLHIRKVNTLENPKMAAEYEVSGVPHIVRVKEGVRTVYKGDRTAQSLYDFGNTD